MSKDPVRDWTTALDAKSIDNRLDYWIQRRVHNAANIVADTRGSSLSDNDYVTMKGNLDSAAKYSELRKQIREIGAEARANAEAIRVREGRTYSPETNHAGGYSYFQDVLRAADPMSPGHKDAMARIRRHGDEVAYEVKRGSAEGQRALRVFRNVSQDTHDPRSEIRAMSTGGTSGGSFVTPQYLTDPKHVAFARSFPASVLRQANVEPIPEFGMTVSTPRITVPAATAAQTEGSALTESSDPAAGLVTSNVVTNGGQVTVSYQLLDRAGPTPSDTLIAAQLRAQHQASVDLMVINAIIAAATTPITRTTWGMAGFLSDVNKASANMEVASNVFLPSSHLFVPPLLWRWISSQVDATTSRPVLVPSAPQDTDGPGDTGYRLGGNLTHIFTDGNIPAATNAQLLVVNMDSVLVFAGEPSVGVVIEGTAASNLQGAVRLWSYDSVQLHYAAAAQVVTGAAYLNSPTFA